MVSDWGREVPYDCDTECDVCGRRGAYDFMGDYLCTDCARDVVNGQDDEEYRTEQ